jgi:hypothetical protein
MPDHDERETEMPDDTTTTAGDPIPGGPPETGEETAPLSAAPEADGGAEPEAHAEQEPTAEEEQARLDAEAPLTDEAVAHAESHTDQQRAELAAEGARWGLIDEEGNVRLHPPQGVEDAPGRVIGKMKGRNPGAALASFVLKFRQIAERVEALEREMAADENKTRFAGRIRTMLGWVPKANALGDFDALLPRLQALEAACRDQLDENFRRKETIVGAMEELSESTDWKHAADAIKARQAEWKTVGPIPRERSDDLWQRFRAAGNRFFERRKAHYEVQEEEQEENLGRKEELCARAEELSASSEWKQAAEGLKALQAEWKAVGPVPKEHNDRVWERFRKANDDFFERRKIHFSELDSDLDENLRRKEELCVRAEELSVSTEWRATAEAFKGLQAEWKAIGAVPKDQHEAVWERFRKAADDFFSRRKVHYDQLEKEQKENLRRKVALCEQAEQLSTAEEFKSTSEALKALQAEWKTVGPVPRVKAEPLWERFRKANDAFFSRRAAYFEQRDQDRSQNHGDWQERLREALDRKRDQADRLRESIAYDEQTADRWRTRLTEIRPGAREQEIRQDTESRLADMEVKLETKRARLQGIEEDVRAIEAKL